MVGSDGRLVGILSLDDVLELLIDEFGAMRGVLASSIATTLAHEHGRRGP